ncbi:hypothetical protein AAC387_Pa09g1336 [Persea americana]
MLALEGTKAHTTTSRSWFFTGTYKEVLRSQKKTEDSGIATGMGTKLAWIRDCWSLFVTNLAPATTTKDLFDVFKEAGPVFYVFLPKDRSSRQGRGFGFVHFKTEWDANRAIQRLNGRIVCGRKLGVQIAKVINRDKVFKAFRSKKGVRIGVC